jgi:uncharacterized protein YcfJ
MLKFCGNLLLPCLQKKENMKRIVIAGFLIAASAPMLAFADNGYGQDERDDYQRPQAMQTQQTYQDSARVTRVSPRFEQVNNPEEQCHMEIERVEPMNNGANNQGRNLGGTVIGGIAGAILGNQVGGGNGRTAATAVGAIGGALIGDRVANGMDNNQYNNQYQGATERQVRRCNTVNHSEERAAGYDVSYQYQGRNYTTLMQHDPGRNVRVNIMVTPVD